MAADKVTIEFSADTKAAIDSLARLQGAVKDVEKEAKSAERSLSARAWKTANTDVEQLGGGMRSLAGDLGKIGIALGGTAAAVGAVGLALGTATAHAEQHARAYRSLGIETWALIQAQTANSVSIEQANRAFQTLARSGLQLSSKEIATLTRAAREHALATGTELEPALEKLTDALRGGSIDGLREFGLQLTEGTSRTRMAHQALAQLERGFRGVSAPAQTTAEAMRSLGTNFLDVASMGGRFIAEFTGVASLIREVGDLTAGAAQALREYFDARDRLKASTARDDANATSAERFERAVRGARSRATLAGVDVDFRRLPRFAELDQRRRDEITSQLEGFLPNAGSALGSLGGSRPRYRADGSIVGARSRTAGQELGDDLMANGPIQGLNFQLSTGNAIAGLGRASGELTRSGTSSANAILAAAEAARIATTRDEARARRPQRARERDFGGGGDNGQGLRDAIRAYQAAIAEAPDGSVTILPADMPQNPRESATAYYTRLAEIQSGFNSAGAVNDLTPAASTGDAEMREAMKRIEQAEQERERGLAARERRMRLNNRDRETRRGAREGSFGGRLASGLGMRSDEEGRLAGFDGASEGVSILTSAVGSLQGGLTTLFDTLVSGSADAGTAFQTFASGLLSELGKLAFQKGLFYTFEGIAALFSAPPAAPLYFAAGAGLIALGAGLGAAGAATKPQVPGPGASSNPGTARGLAPRSSGGKSPSEMGGVTVYLGSLVPAGARDAQRARDGLRVIQRRGFDDATNVPRRVEH